MNGSPAYVADEAPRPSADLMATQFIVEAYLRSVKPKARLRFQQALVQAIEEAAAAPAMLRPAADHGALVVAQRQASTWLTHTMRCIIYRLPTGGA
jgi:hypothetical protein